jgi:hypothetical protein
MLKVEEKIKDKPKDKTNEKLIMGRIAYFFDTLKRLSKFPLNHEPKLEEVESNKSIIQAAYRDMKSLKFEGSVVDYLCWLSTKKLEILWTAEFNPYILSSIEKIELMKIGALSESERILRSKALMIVDQCLSNIEDTCNFLRLFRKNTFDIICETRSLVLLDSMDRGIKIDTKDITVVDYWLFNLFNALYFYILELTNIKKKELLRPNFIEDIITNACRFPSHFLTKKI